MNTYIVYLTATSQEAEEYIQFSITADTEEQAEEMALQNFKRVSVVGGEPRTFVRLIKSACQLIKHDVIEL